MLLLCSVATAQDADVKRIAVFDIDLTEYKAKTNMFRMMLMIDLFKQNALTSIPDHLVQAYADQPEFVVIDKANYQLIEDERERQKSEDFIDGYVVAQGKSEGIDFLVKPKYLSVNNNVSITVYDVANGEVFCQAQTEVIKNKTGPEHTAYYIGQLLDQLNSECFDIKFHVVRATEVKKGKAKELLIGAGKNHQMREDRILEVFNMKDEKIGDKTIKRANVIGECEITLVEGPDFSLAKVKDGDEEIAAMLDNGATLYCRTKVMKKL